MRLLKKRFGEISATITNQIKSLVLEYLESLTKDKRSYDN